MVLVAHAIYYSAIFMIYNLILSDLSMLVEDLEILCDSHSSIVLKVNTMPYSGWI